MKRIKQSNNQTIKQFFLLAAVGLGALSTSASYKVIDADVVVSDAIAAKLNDTWCWSTRALMDLTNGMAKTTGRCPKVYAESKLPATPLKAAVYLGDTQAGKAFLDPKMRAIDFRLVTKGNATYIVARNPTAVSYGAGEYLRRVCDYWFVTVLGDDPWVRNPELVANDLDVAPKPTMYYRSLENGMYNGYKFPTTKFRWEDWNRRTRLECRNCDLEPENRLSWTGGDCHTTFNYCSPKKYFKDHPEYFSMIPGGHRQFQPFGQLCYSNPKVKEIVYESLVSFIEKDRKGRKPGEWDTIYDFSQEDNTSFICTCTNCQKIIEKYTAAADPKAKDAHEKGGDCGLVLEFVNDIARRIAVKYPDVKIRIFAYVSTEYPPKGIRPEPNVMVRFCDLYSACDHELPLTHPFNANGGRDKLFEDWSKLSSHMEIWDYMLSGRDFPEPNVDAIAADAKFFEKIRLSRYFMEAEYRDQPFWELNMFLIGELMFDPSQSADTLVNKFCRVYGKGAADMEKAITFLRKEMRENPPTLMSNWNSRIIPWINIDTMTKFRAFCEAAYAKESEGPARGRIAKILASACCKQMALYRGFMGKDKEYAEATEAYRKYAKENGRWTIMEEKWRAGQDKAVDNWIAHQNLWFDDLPEEFKTASRGDVHCLDSAYFYAEGHAKRIEDPKAYGKRAYFHGFGGRSVPCGVYDHATKASYGLSVKLPEGDIPTDRYVWRKAGVARIGSDSIVWMPGDWYLSVYLKDFFVFCDGMKVDPNWYEFWVSMRVQGQAFNSKDPKDVQSGFMFDRWAMRRVPEPKKK